MTARRPDARSSEAARAIGGLLRMGTVASVDLASGRAIVELEAGLRTPPIPWLGRAGFFKSWLPPYAGEQVAVITPDNDPEQAVILGSAGSNANPAPSSLHQAVLEAADGLRVEYDVATRTLSIDCPDIIKIKAKTLTIEVDEPVQIKGALKVTQPVTAPAFVQGGGV